MDHETSKKLSTGTSVAVSAVSSGGSSVGSYKYEGGFGIHE